MAYAGGGGGGGNSTNAPNFGAGGLGGGGDGNATAGTANTGGGGGGSGANAGGAGGSGIVILRIPSLYTATFSAGITANVSTSTTQIGYRTYTVTAGTGTVTFN